MRNKKIWLSVGTTLGLAAMAHVIYWHVGNTERKTDPMKRILTWLQKR